jgi:hypothetical protein
MTIKTLHFELYSNQITIRLKGKLRDLGIVFKPRFKCFKNEKINFIQAFLKTRNFTLSDHVYIILSYSIFKERFRLKQKKSGLVV